MKRIIFGLLLFISMLFAKIDINSADVNELSTLKGIGSKKAERIVEYRDKNGKFKSIDELVKVKGIGVKTVEKIKDEIEIK